MGGICKSKSRLFLSEETIHEVADPQTMSIMFWSEAH